MEATLTPAAKVLIVNAQHNPTGADADADDIEWLAALANERDLWVLSDDPYHDIRFDGQTSRTLVGLPGIFDHCVIGYTFSKKYAMTGWRLGAAIGPRDVVDVITKLNTNDESCTNHFVQLAGVEALTGDQSGAEAIVRTLAKRREEVVAGLRAIDGVQVPDTAATFYLFVDVSAVFERMGDGDPHQFRVDTMHSTGVSFCSRTHFGRELPGEGRTWVRFAYSGIDAGDAAEGLERLKDYWES